MYLKGRMHSKSLDILSAKKWNFDYFFDYFMDYFHFSKLQTPDKINKLREIFLNKEKFDDFDIKDFLNGFKNNTNV